MKRWRVESRCPVRDEDWRIVATYETLSIAQAVAGNLRCQCLRARVLWLDEAGEWREWR